MPTYMFTCKACGHELEIVRKFVEAGDPVVCPECDHMMIRVFTPVPEIWKTGGVYKTDYFPDNRFSGSKQDYIRKQYEHQYGEKAPDPIKE